MDLVVLRDEENMACAVLFGNLHEAPGIDPWLRGSTNEIPGLGGLDSIALPMDCKCGEHDWEHIVDSVSSFVRTHRLNTLFMPIVVPGVITALAKQYGVLAASFVPHLAFCDKDVRRDWDQNVALLRNQCIMDLPFMATVREIEVDNVCAYTCPWIREYLLCAHGGPLPSSRLSERIWTTNRVPGFLHSDYLRVHPDVGIATDLKAEDVSTAKHQMVAHFTRIKKLQAVQDQLWASVELSGDHREEFKLRTGYDSHRAFFDDLNRTTLASTDGDSLAVFKNETFSAVSSPQKLPNRVPVVNTQSWAHPLFHTTPHPYPHPHLRTPFGH